MSHFIQIIHDHLQEQGHKPKLTHLRSNGYPTIINRLGGYHHIIEHQDHLRFLGGGPLEHLHKADPQLLPKITKWWEEQ